ncbi:hypothetical protein EX30DRAFT_393334 [Ascodesmis nigricans]|uniref:Uncharacterized protein n=1 Tax=Ascodesmis nigricans TaxID=341454 RepID=A0A4S2N3L1_9PEZI|nr:hypothetical protein EX30DRAFT_393334 [Ascodesmis nigricans]
MTSTTSPSPPPPDPNTTPPTPSQPPSLATPSPPTSTVRIAPNPQTPLHCYEPPTKKRRGRTPGSQGFLELDKQRFFTALRNVIFPAALNPAYTDSENGVPVNRPPFRPIENLNPDPYYWPWPKIANTYNNMSKKVGRKERDGDFLRAFFEERVREAEKQGQAGGVVEWNASEAWRIKCDVEGKGWRDPGGEEVVNGSVTKAEKPAGEGDGDQKPGKITESGEKEEDAAVARNPTTTTTTPSATTTTPSATTTTTIPPAPPNPAPATRPRTIAPAPAPSRHNSTPSAGLESSIHAPHHFPQHPPPQPPPPHHPPPSHSHPPPPPNAPLSASIHAPPPNPFTLPHHPHHPPPHHPHPQFPPPPQPPQQQHFTPQFPSSSPLHSEPPLLDAVRAVYESRIASLEAELQIKREKLVGAERRIDELVDVVRRLTVENEVMKAVRGVVGSGNGGGNGSAGAGAGEVKDG